jgi:hypothetical protein
MNLNIQEMSREEKLQTMHAIWEILVQEDEAVESPSWHAEALRETETKMQTGSERVWDWQAAKEELRKRAQ